MSVKKLSFYLKDDDISMWNDYLPLKKFLCKMALNVNAIGLYSSVLPEYSLNVLRILKIFGLTKLPDW